MSVSTVGRDSDNVEWNRIGRQVPHESLDSGFEKLATSLSEGSWSGDLGNLRIAGLSQCEERGKRTRQGKKEEIPKE